MALLINILRMLQMVITGKELLLEIIEAWLGKKHSTIEFVTIKSYKLIFL